MHVSPRASLAALLLTVGCARTLPPPAVPERSVPDLGELPAAAEGEGRVILDVPDGPTEVFHWVSAQEVVGRDKDGPITASRVGTELLCVTPCSIAGPYGSVDLGFPIPGGRGLEIASVEIRAETTVYRRALGRHGGPGAGLALGIVGLSFGSVSALVGAVLLPVGLSQGDEDGMVIAGAITLAVGALVYALGLWGVLEDSGFEQRGAAIQFDVPRFEVGAGVDASASMPR